MPDKGDRQIDVLVGIEFKGKQHGQSIQNLFHQESSLPLAETIIISIGLGGILQDTLYYFRRRSVYGINFGKTVTCNS